jgi:hypothetical protein
MAAIVPTPASSLRHLPSLHKTPTPKRAILEDKAADLEDRLALERKARLEADQKTVKLKERMQYLEAMAAELDQTRTTHKAFVEAKTAQFESRRQPLGDEGMLTFSAHSKFGEGNSVKPSRIGRNSRRTAFTTDFRGVHILGDSEFVHKWRLQNRAEEIMGAREQERSALRDRKAAARAAGATGATGGGGGGGRTSTTPQPASSNANNATRAASSVSGQTTATTSNPEWVSRRRANGLPTLDACKHASSRRTKFYVNYEGKRIMMDPCDWPEEHDFVLIGL